MISFSIKDEPTVDEINDFLERLPLMYISLAFDAILKQDEERARQFLEQVKSGYLMDASQAGLRLHELAKEVFFEGEQNERHRRPRPPARGDDPAATAGA